MSRREILLWVIFVVLFFAAGYLKGILPEYRFQFFWSDKEKVKILAYSEKLLPPFLLEDLEQRTHTKIELDVSTTFSDYLTKSISSSQYSLFIAPRNWAEALRDQNLLLPLSGLRNYLAKKLHADFSVLNNRIFPWAWVPTVFITRPKTELKSLKSVAVIKDDDHLVQILRSIKLNSPQIPIKMISLLDEADEISDSEIKEINLFMKASYGDIRIRNEWPESLFLFDLIVPQNTPRRVTSIDILKSLFDSQHLMREMAQLPYGLTQNFFDTEMFPSEKKPSALRSLSLQKLMRAKPIESDEKKEFLRSFNIIKLF